MYIEFTKVTGKNFLSIGNNPLSLKLNEYHKSLIIGKNGNGKSIWLDLIIYALYGKAYRNINKSAIVNSINGKQCETEIEFSINEKNYKVIRSIKPDKFEIYIDGVLLTQDAATKDYQEYLDTQILKMDYKTCCQMLVIGAMNYIPFLQLKSADRRTFIESILDLQLFTDFNKNLKLIIADEKTIYTNLQQNVNLHKSKIETYTKIINDLESSKDRQKEELNLAIKEKIASYREALDKVEKNKQLLEKIQFIDNADELQNLIIKSGSNISSAEASNTKLKSKIKFFDTTSECSNCEQSIDPLHKQKHIDAMQLEINNNDNIIQENTKVKKEAYDKSTELSSIKTKKRQVEETIKSDIGTSEWIKSVLVGYGKQKEALDTKDDSTLKNSKDELEKTIQLQSEAELKLKESYDILQVYGIMLNDLKDTGAKSNIISKYIPIINATVNSYLDKFNLYVKFQLDEQFNETLKSRHRDDFTYESFSNGERFRIDLSMLFAWKELSKARAGVTSNLLFVDELLEIVDDTGVDEFLSLINSKTNLFVISHKENLDIKFDNVITMVKVKEFSQIE